MKLSYKIISTVIVSIIILNVFYYGYRVSTLRGVINNSFEKRIENLLFTTIEGSKQSLYNLDFKNLEFFINTILMDESVKGILFKNKFNVTIAFVNNDKVIVYKGVDEDKVQVNTDESTIIKQGKITFNNLNERVKIYFSRKEVDKQMDNVFVDQAIEFFITMVLLTILLFFTIQLIVLKPIRKLTVFSNGISRNLTDVRHALAEEKYGNQILSNLNTIIINESRLSHDELGNLQHTMVEMATTR